MGLFKYIKAAFANRWNLLALAGGVGFSILSGNPEIGLSLVSAAEVAWLGLVGTHPKFQTYVDTQEHEAQRSQQASSADIRMRRMLSSLPRGAQQRFRELMDRCEELRTITSQFHAAQGDADDDATFVNMRLDGLDHLLWLFLKLLYTENSLNRFFETTTIDEINKEVSQIEARLARERKRNGSQQRERIIATLDDNLQTCLKRQANFEQARDSYELVKAEQKRLENKIRSIAEMGISRGDPGLLSSQVDSVAGSIQETEKTLNDLRFVTGFSTEDEAVPEIVRRNVLAK